CGHREAGVDHRLGLAADGVDDGVGRMAQVEHADPAGEVDVLLAVDVDQTCAVCSVGHDRGQRHAARHVRVALRHQLYGPRSRHLHSHGTTPLPIDVYASDYKPHHLGQVNPPGRLGLP